MGEEEGAGGGDGSRGRSTLAVHGGEPAVRDDRSLTTPVVMSTAYPFADTAELRDHMERRIERPEEYGRYGNPTVQVAEAKLASLDGGEAAVLMSSGMAAITTTLLAMLRQGHHVVFTSDVYRKTRQFARQLLTRYGVEIAVVDPDIDAIEAALTDKTRIIFTETPTNPYLRIVDLASLATLAKSRRIKTIVDATFATPMNLRPLELGIDLVVHSTTKYIGGHNDIMGGVVVGKRSLIDAIRDHLGMLGAVLDPHNAYMLLRGAKTLALRVRQQNASALELATLVGEHPAVSRVWYPLHASHPDYARARTMLAGGGGVVTFELAGGLAAGTKLVDGLQIPKLAPSLGGVESLAEQPALMSFYELEPQQRAALGIAEGLIRYAVGIEDTADLADDLRRGLDRL